MYRSLLFLCYTWKCIQNPNVQLYYIQFRANLPRVRTSPPLQVSSQPLPPPPPPTMGDKERGGLNPSCPAVLQQQQQQPVTPRGSHTLPTSAWGGRQPDGPSSAATPHVWGSRRGDQQQQQQQHAKAAPPMDPARHAHALNLYREHVRAGFWARVTFEQLPDGEHVSLLFRPMAAATAAAGEKSDKKIKRRQNKKRQEKRLRWCQARDSRTAAAATPVQQLSVVAGPAPRQQLLVNLSRQQPQSLLTLSAGQAAAATAAAAPAPAVAAAATPAVAATASHAAAAAPDAAAEAATPAVIGILPAPLHPARSRVFEPVSRETRSRSKRKKIDSQEDTAQPIPQLDGADLELSPAPLPPPLPPSPCHVGSPSAPTCSPSDGDVGSPSAPTSPPLPPPPWHVGSPTAPTCPFIGDGVGSPSASTCPPSDDDVGPPSAPTSRPLPPLDVPPDEPSTAAVGPTPPAPLWLARLPPHLSICKLCRADCHGPNYNSCSSCYQKKTNC